MYFHLKKKKMFTEHNFLY